MNNVSSKIIIFFISIIISGTVISEDKNISSTPWLVKTHGIWESEKYYGYFRVTVNRQVGEHGADDVIVDILKVEQNGVLKIIRTIPLNTPNYKGYVTDISFNMIDKKRIAISLDIEMKGMYGIKMRDIFLVSIDGTVQQVATASFKDL
jgi:hypothetical protein